MSTRGIEGEWGFHAVEAPIFDVLLPKHRIIFGVVANPEPEQSILDFNGQGTAGKPGANGPEATRFF